MYWLLLSKFLTNAFVWGNIMYNCIITELLIYPIKYLITPLLAYEFFGDNTNF